MSLFGRTAPPSKRPAEAGENPFWISYADLMTALMVLFLVALTVALFAITQTVNEEAQQKETRSDEIADFMQQLRALSERHTGISVRGTAIDFGERARFRSNSHRLEPEQVRLLRDFVPQVLELARQPLGARWLKRITVIGYADARGQYLYNLNLSLQRSQRVLCALLVPQATLSPLSESDRQDMRRLFMVSGASFNALKDSPEASRRIELRLEFLEKGEASAPSSALPADEDPRCPLDLA